MPGRKVNKAKRPANLSIIAIILSINPNYNKYIVQADVDIAILQYLNP